MNLNLLFRSLIGKYILSTALLRIDSPKVGGIKQCTAYLWQREAVAMTKTYFESSGEEFLWNAKPRFGKTLTSYDLIQQMDSTKVLIVDKAQEGMDTMKTERTFCNIKRRHTLYLSGTPFKQLAMFTYQLSGMIREKMSGDWTSLMKGIPLIMLSTSTNFLSPMRAENSFMRKRSKSFSTP